MPGENYVRYTQLFNFYRALDNNPPDARAGTINTDTRPFYIGGRAGTDYFDGIIDDVRVYNRSLYQQEITSLAGMINNTPTITGVADVNVNEDAVDTVINLFGEFDDIEDADADLTYTITSNTNSGLFDATNIDGVAGTLTLDYAANQSGTSDITIRATDTGGLWVEDTFTVTVTAQNDTPITSNIADVNVNEDAVDTVVDLFGAFDDTEDTDADLTYTIASNTNGGLFDSTTIDGGAGTLTLDYGANQNGTADITVRATDSGELWVEDTFTVTVNAANDAPVAVDDSASTNEDTSVTTGNVLANDGDLDGDPLTIDSYTQPTHGTVGYNSDGTFTYTPNADYSGSDSFTYNITDGNDGTDSATVNITVDDIPEPEPDPVIIEKPTDTTPPEVIFPPNDNTLFGSDDIFNPGSEPPVIISPPDNIIPTDSNDQDEISDDISSTPTPDEGTTEDENSTDEPTGDNQNFSDNSDNSPSNQTKSRENSQLDSKDWNHSEKDNAVRITAATRGEVNSQVANSHSESETPVTYANSEGVEFDSSDNMQINGTVQFHPNAAQLQNEMFQQQLDSLTEQIDEQIDTQAQAETVAVGVVTGVTGAVSFGYGLWVLKGGSLLASMASSLPVLNSIDPLPVLEHCGKGSVQRWWHPKAKPVIKDADELKISSLLK